MHARYASVVEASDATRDAKRVRTVTDPLEPREITPEQAMDRLRLFVSLRALSEGRDDPEALGTVEAELTRLERELAGHGETVQPFRLAQEDLDNLVLLKVRQSLEPEGKVRRVAPLRWCYGLARRFVLTTQRRYNESVTHLIRRLFSTALLTRYYQLRAVLLERRLDDVEARIARTETRAAPTSPPPSEPKP